MTTRYEIDPTASTMAFDGRSSLHPINAETKGLTGWIDATVASERSADDVSINAGCLEIPLAKLASGNPLYDMELQRRIDIRRHPTATAVLSQWDPAGGPGTYRVRGDVTFRGVTLTMDDVLTLSMRDDGAVVIYGSRVFDIRDFGMDPPRLLALRVHPEVTIRIVLLCVPA